MAQTIITTLFFPLSLGIIMLGMGLSLTIDDFKRIAIYPKAVAVGIFNQIIILPIIAFIILMLFPQQTPELAVGIMIIAACPGGPSSNLISHISKGDTALSITLTFLSSIIIIITLPLIVNFSLQHFIKQEGFVPLPVFDTSLKVLLFTMVPVAIGMLIKTKAPSLSLKLDKPFKILSGIVLVAVIATAIIKDKKNVIESFEQIGPVALLLNILTLLIAYYSSRMMKLNIAQSKTIAIEGGIQNATLGITVAAAFLHNSAMTVAPAIYGLIMFTSAGFIIGGSNISFKKK